jgi:hypothetical protein
VALLAVGTASVLRWCAFGARGTPSSVRPGTARPIRPACVRRRRAGSEDASAESWTIWAGCLSAAVPGIRKGARQPVELGHHERIAGSARRHRFTEPRAHPIRSRKSVIDEDLGLLYPRAKRALRWAVRSWSFVETPGITDLHSSHREHGCSNPPVTVHLIVRGLRTWPRPATARNVVAGFRGTVIDRLTDILGQLPSAAGYFAESYRKASFGSHRVCRGSMPT